VVTTVGINLISKSAFLSPSEAVICSWVRPSPYTELIEIIEVNIRKIAPPEVAMNRTVINKKEFITYIYCLFEYNTLVVYS
jgi:hypothetical protein